jgi:hypothetical protein
VWRYNAKSDIYREFGYLVALAHQLGTYSISELRTLGERLTVGPPPITTLHYDTQRVWFKRMDRSGGITDTFLQIKTQKRGMRSAAPEDRALAMVGLKPILIESGQRGRLDGKRLDKEANREEQWPTDIRYQFYARPPKQILLQVNRKFHLTAKGYATQGGLHAVSRNLDLPTAAPSRYKPFHSFSASDREAHPERKTADASTPEDRIIGIAQSLIRERDRALIAFLRPRRRCEAGNRCSPGDIWPVPGQKHASAQL